MRLLLDYFPWLGEPNLLSMLIRMVAALVCAGLIGYDRNTHGAAAGVRTHILVCIGAVIAMSTGQFTSLMFGNADITRIGAQVVSGIGFLGAGSIIVTRSRHISGLTTAAGLWASACIGLAIGVGFYEGAVMGTLAVYFTERFLRNWSKGIRITNKADVYGNIERDTSADD